MAPGWVETIVAAIKILQSRKCLIFGFVQHLNHININYPSWTSKFQKSKWLKKLQKMNEHDENEDSTEMKVDIEALITEN